MPYLKVYIDPVTDCKGDDLEETHIETEAEHLIGKALRNDDNFPDKFKVAARYYTTE